MGSIICLNLWYCFGLLSFKVFIWNDMKWVFFCVIEINWNAKRPPVWDHENSKSKVSHFCRQTFFFFASLTFYAYEHLCVTVSWASIIAHVYRLKSLYTNVPLATPLFTAFNRLYDKLLINKKLLEANVNKHTFIQASAHLPWHIFIHPHSSIHPAPNYHFHFHAKTGSDCPRRFIYFIMFYSPHVFKPQCAYTVSQRWIIAVISK